MMTLLEMLDAANRALKDGQIDEAERWMEILHEAALAADHQESSERLQRILDRGPTRFLPDDSAQKDRDEYREEMSQGGQWYEPNS